MSRISDVTDHTGAITRYNYDLRGGMTKVTADYGTGNAKETAYVLNANGATTKQTLPSGYVNQFVYDDGGRVTSQVLMDLSRMKILESYAYNYSPTGLPSFTYGYTRTELNGDVYTFVNDRMGRLKQEKKVNSGAVTQYQQDFSYDKNGNRLSMQQTGSGSGISSYTYTYTYDAQGKLTYIKDVARYYTGTITTDANGNITSVNEAWTGTANTWKTDFTFDYENRLNKISISVIAGGKTVVCNSISHAYDGLNRLIKTTAGNNYGHVYDGNKLAGNANLTTSTNGTAWVNAANAAKPLASTQIQTVGATRYYNVSDERDPVRQVYTDAGTAGDTSQKSRYSEYKLIDGAAPTMVTYGGAIKQSELFRVRNITLNENSIVLPSANGSFEAAAISLNYEGTRVKSALIGRDLNPMGRGDGVYYFAGAMSTSAVLPNIGTNHHSGTGNSVNNCGQCSGGSDSTQSCLIININNDKKNKLVERSNISTSLTTLDITTTSTQLTSNVPTPLQSNVIIPWNIKIDPFPALPSISIACWDAKLAYRDLLTTVQSMYPILFNDAPGSICQYIQPKLNQNALDTALDGREKSCKWACIDGAARRYKELEKQGKYQGMTLFQKANEYTKLLVNCESYCRQLRFAYERMLKACCK